MCVCMREREREERESLTEMAREKYRVNQTQTEEVGRRENESERGDEKPGRERSSYREKERKGTERGKCVYVWFRGVKRKKRGDRGSVSGDVLFKEVSPCLMSLV